MRWFFFVCFELVWLVGSHVWAKVQLAGESMIELGVQAGQCAFGARFSVKLLVFPKTHLSAVLMRHKLSPRRMGHNNLSQPLNEK